ncbi:MAG TPA: L-threonylcarbamoyladenylate synthase [Methanomicrobiales archaeon]|jgi:L-threonylcarbamoyladenylate synthase|nr:L-threonylcarbamoyladenylate synthase [Methanomicrobiales archaeon]
MDIVERAVQVLRRDGIIVYPTDTVYGLGGDAFSDEAILRVYEAKGRPVGKPISIAVSDTDMLCAVACADEFALGFAGRFLPGPVTVILEARSCVPPLLTGGTGRIGIRIPAYDLALGIISGFDSPITATSANMAGEKDPASPNEVRVPYDLLVDGGVLPGTPSTVVDLVDLRVLREGALANEVAAYLREEGGPGA